MAVVAVTLQQPCAPATAADVTWQPLGVAGWYTGAGAGGESPNWASGIGEMYLPSADYSEVALINNGGVAFVDSVADGTISRPFPGGVVLGRGVADTGSLEVRSGGSLTVVPGTNAGEAPGSVIVGQAGVGTLVVQRGGSLTAESLSLGGGGASSITLGASGSGAATLHSLGNATLNRTTHIVGPNVDFRVDGNLTLGGSSVLVAEITDSLAHSPIVTGGSATLGGLLQVDFNGVTPTVGSSWPLVDAPIVSGSFAAVQATGAGPLGPGQEFRVNRESGGTNGQLVSVSLAQLLTLRADWDTGEVSIHNTSPTDSVSFDGYSVLSALGALDTASDWNSLAEQGLPSWAEAGRTAQAISELKFSGTTTVAPGTSWSLGELFDPLIPAFGQSPTDLAFEYREDSGYIASGIVEYTGNRVYNTLVLTVDPATGEAQLKNDSPYTVQLEGYSILSDSGSLQPGDSDWSSLGDQAVPGWFEASPTASALSELTPGAGLTLPGGASYNLGDVFDTLGSQDLLLEFFLAGDVNGRPGQVVFGDIRPGLPGDFNLDGRVDAADYTVWRDGLGAAYTQADYDVWRDNYGSVAGAAAGAQGVPEPGAALLAAIVAASAIARRSC